jgi:hypothetical protein
MRLNLKQEELIKELFNKVKEKYPEIEYKNLEVNPDDHEHILINVNADIDEEREIELRFYSAGLEADIHSDYGYRFSIMPENPNAVYA